VSAREGAVGRVPIELPAPALRSGAVRLRAPSGDDVAAVYEACRDPAIQRYTRVPRDYDRLDARAFVAGAEARRREGLSLEMVVTDRDDRVLCGVVGLVVDRHDQARAEIGYWIHPAHRGRGLARAGLLLLSRWALGPAGFVRLDLTASVRNAGSLAVVEGTGFVREGVARAAWPTPEGREDMAVFSLLAGDVGASFPRPGRRPGA
jgi:RimJ/RimL family protein N-acetyltransferase